jgi:hypothetical protein
VQHAEKFIKCIDQFASRNSIMVGFPGVNSCINDQMISHFYTNYMKLPWTNIGIQYQTIPWKKRPKTELPYLFHFFNINPWTMNLEEFPDLTVWWMVAQALCEEDKNISDFVPMSTSGNLELVTTYSPGKCLWCDKTDHSFCTYSPTCLTIACPGWV